jgi:drug/metabolite transporter (DMT)-like permease
VPASDPTSIAIGIGCGLTASVAWALANLLIQRTSKVDGPVRPVLAGQVVGALLLLLAIPLAPPTDLPLPWGWLAVGGAASLLGYVAMFRAFAMGPLSIVSATVAGWALISAALGVALFDEALPASRAVGGTLVMMGVFGLALSQPTAGQQWTHGRLVGIGTALLAALGFGLMVVASRPIELSLGTPLTIMVLWAVQWLALLPWVLVRHGPHPLPPKQIGLAVAAFGALEAIGFVAVVAGGALAPLSVVAPTASLGALLTAVLARWHLGERLSAGQWGLAVAVVGGVALLSQ